MHAGVYAISGALLELHGPSTADPSQKNGATPSLEVTHCSGLSQRIYCLATIPWPNELKVCKHRLSTHKLQNPPRHTLTTSTPSYAVGNMSRTVSFRNACCRQEIESTTKRAKSQTKRSSERHRVTRTAKS